VSEQKAAPAAIAEQTSRNLLARVAAAAVLVPIALAAAYAGGRWWTALVTSAVIGLYVEWLAVVGSLQATRVVASGVIALALIGVSLGLGRPEAVLSAWVLGLAGVVLLTSERRSWVAGGFLYASVAQLAAIAVRADPVKGFDALIFVLFVVWATDIGGYFAGRSIGGVKLWPSVSPNKTWAGAIGGLLLSLVVAAMFVALGRGKALPLFCLAAALSVAGQLGDLLESAVKRRFGVKDSSHLIPGHGGLLDRLDSLVTALVLAAIFGLLRPGADGVGRALMVW
jgi:phosphatidate cytidylyltransferase